MESVVELEGTSRRYRGGVLALDNVSLAVPAGQFVAVMGATGSGKSTLLHCAAGLDRPTTGRVRLAGRDITRMRESALTRLRRDRVGFLALLRRAVDVDGVTVVMVTHDPAAAAWSDRLVLLRAGTVAADSATPDESTIGAELAAVAA